VCILAVLLLTASFASARDLSVGTLHEDARVQVLSSTADDTLLRFEVGTFRLHDVDVDGETWSRIGWTGGVERLETGAPALPGFHESLMIPDDAHMVVTVLGAEYTDFAGERIAPSKGPITRDILPQDVPYSFGNEYQADAFLPVQIASLGEPYILRDVRGVVVRVEPFQWNPATQTLRVYHSIDVRVTAAGPGEQNVLTHRPNVRVADFEEAYRRHFLNYGSQLRYVPVGEVGCMRVICYDSFMTAMQPFVDWKNRMGLETTMVPMSAVGSTANSLKAYIQGEYDNNGACFFLLVGDGPQIPYFTNGGGAADPVMCLLAGSDSYPDAYIGRISAATVSQVETQVERIVEYESAPDPAGTWYAKGVAIASNEGDGIGDDGEPDWEHAQNYRADLLGFTYSLVNELYDGTHPSSGGGGVGGFDAGADATGNPSASQLTTLLNDGRGLVHYTGHGSSTSWVTTGFNNTNINNLVNDNMLPFVVSVGCVNGEFMFSTCFAETWMRATNNGEPTGAITCYASTVNQQWATPMRAQDEMIDLMCQSEKRTWGGLCFNGSCDMIDHYGNNGINEFKNWTVFGDPSLRVRTATPTALAVSHAGSVTASNGLFEVTTAPFAMVGLSESNQFLASTFADAAGYAAVTFDPADLAGLSEVTLTVTGFNRIPDVGTVPVVTGGTAAPVVAAGGGILASPNPFSASTSISFALVNDSAVQLDVYDVGGRHVASVSNTVLPAGSHRLTWNGTNDAGFRVPSGSYFYRL
ncbi:hypothetical protein K8I85_03180, partial [bacterium]|nr:hypothetical protein [bacterium]